MTNYIGFPVETNPTVLLQRVYDYLEAVAPGWTPAEGNLDVWLAEAFSTEVAELTDVASAVPDTIFRYFGSSLMGVQPIDATSATGNTTWTMRDNLGYTIPAGTQVGVRNDSGELIPFITVNEVTVAPGSTATAAGAIAIAAVNPGADTSGLGLAVELIDILDYVTGVVLTADTTGGQDAESDGEYLNRLVDQLHLLSATPILPQDFAQMALNVPPAFRATALDLYNPYHNLLTANEASLEIDVAGWVTVANCAVARSVAQAADGVASLSITSSASGTMSANQVAAGAKSVTPGEVITALASFRSAVSARSCQVIIQWLTAADVPITTTLGTTGNDTTTGWTQLSATGIAPATAGKAKIILQIAATGAASEVHYADKMSLRRGSTTDWVAGGTNDTGNARMVTVAVIDSAGEPLSAGGRSNVSTYLQSLREVNFVVNVIDPVYVTIDVTASVRIMPGAVASQVTASVQAALTDYFNPANWGRPIAYGDQPSSQTDWSNQTTVRKFEVSQIINAVDGVDYIITLTLGRQGTTLAEQDVYLGASLPMTRPGVMTVTSA